MAEFFATHQDIGNSLKFCEILLSLSQLKGFANFCPDLYITLDHFFLLLQNCQDLVETQSSSRSNSLRLPRLWQKNP